jgi:nicotinamide phosphoribosyltransferase
MQIEQYFAPSAADVAYDQPNQLKISLICRIDSYKFSHPFAYPDGIKGMTSYGEARVKPDVVIIPFGMQLLLKRYLTQRITMADIDAAEAFSEAHFGRKLFARKQWEKVVHVYDGFLPLIIRAVPEGTPIRGGQPIYTVTVLDEDLFWLSAGFETLIQRGIWYPTTIATNDYNIKGKIKQYYINTGADMGLLPFALHDFGGRGVTSAETAEIGGAAHLVNFMGSDTVEGVLTANFYYKEAMAGFSVYATEHSIQCSFGGGTEDAIAYIRKQLQSAKDLGVQIISIVLDGYDVYREAELCCTILKDDIIASGVKVVFRPDSGDMMEVVPRILHLQDAAFGHTLTEKGYKKINNVGVIQGDGVDHHAITNLLGRITVIDGYSADCVVFGSGGALLQKVNRDTYKFAQKASAILVEDENGKEYWKGIAKDPVTDAGKKSKEGVLTLVRSKMNNELMPARLDQGPLDSEWEDVMQLVYFKGQLYNETTFAEVRARAA